MRLGMGQETENVTSKILNLPVKHCCILQALALHGSFFGIKNENSRYFGTNQKQNKARLPILNFSLPHQLHASYLSYLPNPTQMSILSETSTFFMNVKRTKYDGGRLH